MEIASSEESAGTILLILAGIITAVTLAAWFII